MYLSGISVVLPAIGQAFHIDSAQQGKLFPANFAGMIVSVLVCGTLSDRWGRKNVLLVSAGLYAAGLLLFGLAPTFGLALCAAPLVGAGSGGMQIVSSALASDLFPRTPRRDFERFAGGVRRRSGGGADGGTRFAGTRRGLAIFVPRIGSCAAGPVREFDFSERAANRQCVRDVALGRFENAAAAAGIRPAVPHTVLLCGRGSRIFSVDADLLSSAAAGHSLRRRDCGRVLGRNDAGPCHNGPAAGTPACAAAGHGTGYCRRNVRRADSAHGGAFCGIMFCRTDGPVFRRDLQRGAGGSGGAVSASRRNCFRRHCGTGGRGLRGDSLGHWSGWFEQCGSGTSHSESCRC